MSVLAGSGYLALISLSSLTLITIVGFPMDFIRPQGWPLVRPNERFARQSFLGPRAQLVIETRASGLSAWAVVAHILSNSWLISESITLPASTVM